MMMIDGRLNGNTILLCVNRSLADSTLQRDLTAL